jgi:HEAT repeat protein
MAGGDADSKVRLEAFKALERLFPDNEEYDAAHDRAHRDHYAKADDESRRETLARFGNDAKRAVRELTRELREGAATSRAVAAWRLEDLGADAEAAIPALTAALRDADDGVRYAAFSALREIGLPPVQELLPLVDELEPALRWGVRAVLRDRRAEIEELAKSGDPGIRKAAERALDLLRDRK